MNTKLFPNLFLNVELSLFDVEKDFHETTNVLKKYSENAQDADRHARSSTRNRKTEASAVAKFAMVRETEKGE